MDLTRAGLQCCVGWVPAIYPGSFYFNGLPHEVDCFAGRSMTLSQNAGTDIDPMDPGMYILSENPLRYSIVIPTRGRQDSLEKCLDSIHNLDYPKTLYEVIVVFDGDKENYPRVKSSSNPVDPNLRSVFQERTGPSGARNHSAQLARGRYLGFTDFSHGVT